jgi:hypothetical protein
LRAVPRVDPARGRAGVALAKTEMEAMMSETQLRNLFELIRSGFLVAYPDPEDGTERIRLTPKGARAIGEKDLARHLELCAAGQHAFLEGLKNCVCGERRAPLG